MPSSAALIYVVEDDAQVAQLVASTLRAFGFGSVTFPTGAALLQRLRHERPDLCIIDLGLPDVDGIDLVREIAGQWNCGLLILTGRAHPADRVMGLELGGDDYMLKPFEPRELVARVRSILRRRRLALGAVVPGASPRHARFAGWQLDCAANLLTDPAGREHLLGTAEAQVLRAFLLRPQQILAREQLLGSRELPASDRTIDVRISRLRRRLEADPQHPKIIKTVYGAGYMLACGVDWR